MIFVTENNPTTRGYINKVTERDMPNGGKIKNYLFGTRETKQDGTKVYSNWWFTTMGNARKNEAQLEEGAFVEIKGFKMTNVSKKNDDGTWSRPYFNMSVCDFEVVGASNESSSEEGNDEDSPF